MEERDDHANGLEAMMPKGKVLFFIQEVKSHIMVWFWDVFK